MYKVLVTGGLGFIGSNLIHMLLNKKIKVINVDKVTYSSNFYNTENIPNRKNYKFIKCDIKNFFFIINVTLNKFIIFIIWYTFQIIKI